MQRWENQFVTHRESLLEQYQQGRFTVVCDLDICRSAIVEAGAVASDYPSANTDLCASGVFCPDFTNGAGLPNWNQQPVFVQNVETVQGPEGVIPSIIGFYNIHDEISDCFGGL